MIRLIAKIKAYMDKSWKKRRVLEIKRALVEDMDAKYMGEPHILAGIYFWKNIPNSIDIDIFFPNKPLAVIVADRSYSRYSETSTVINRKCWKSAMEHTSFNVRACHLARIPVIFVAPDDPIDPSSLALAADEAFLLDKVLSKCP